VEGPRAGGVTVDQDEVDGLLGGKPEDVLARLRGREGGDSRGDPALAEVVPLPPELLGYLSQALALARLQQAHQDQLAVGLRGEGYRKREQRIDALRIERSDQQGTIGIGRSHALGPHRQLEIGILLKDPPLEALQRRGGLETDLVDERVPRGLVGVECLGLPTRAVEREHQLPGQAFS
jgi:hypothetical protein